LKQYESIHIKEEITSEYDPVKIIGLIKTDLPYAFKLEFGAKNQFAHPFIKPAQITARATMKAIMKKVIKEAIAEEKK
jgi:hypothetical protein